jgi:hypothetical protein
MDDRLGMGRMSREPVFKLEPGGDHYLMTLAGVVLILGDTIYGNPAETTPQGRANAKHMLDRVLTEATSRGFRHADTLRALLRRNTGGARLANLAQQAVDVIPKPVQSKMMENMLRDAPDAYVPPAIVPHEVALGEVDPRFWEAGLELQRVAAEEGPEAVQKQEHAHLFTEMMRYAPEPLKSEMHAKAHEMGLIPKATYVDNNGQPVYSAEQLAETHGVTVDEVLDTIERAGIADDGLYTGPVLPLQ